MCSGVGLVWSWPQWKRTSPRYGCSRTSVRSSVVLPEPFRPIRAVMAPRAIDVVTPLRIARPPSTTCKSRIVTSGEASSRTVNGFISYHRGTETQRKNEEIVDIHSILFFLLCVLCASVVPNLFHGIAEGGEVRAHLRFIPSRRQRVRRHRLQRVDFHQRRIGDPAPLQFLHDRRRRRVRTILRFHRDQ